jgi:alkylated DNA repair protein alkB family protein 8
VIYFNFKVFENQELEDLFKNISEARIVKSFYEQGNWCAIFEKIKP